VHLVGNGYLSTTLGDDTVYVSGVFNPLQPNDPNSRSRRSRFPTPVRISVQGASMFATALDTRRGIYYRRSFLKLDNNGAPVTGNKDPIISNVPKFHEHFILIQSIEGARTSCLALFEQRWYAHRVNRSLLIHEMEVDVSRCPGDAQRNLLTFYLIVDNGGNSKDINFTQLNNNTRNNDNIPLLFAGSTILPEKPGGILIGTAYATTSIDATISVPSGSSSTTYYHITTYLTSLDFMDYPLPLRYSRSSSSAFILPPSQHNQRRSGAPTCRPNSEFRMDCGRAMLSQGACVSMGCCYEVLSEVHI